MRTDKKISSLVAAAVGASVLIAGSMTFAAGGATIGQRVVSDQVISGTNTPPTQGIAAGCGATCELWAREGSVTVGTATVPVWGFSTSESDPLSLPGPTIVVTAGNPVALTVHNALTTGDLDLDITGVAANGLVRSAAAIAPGSAGTLTFTATQVGTSIYRAGASTPQGNRQLAMGLAGVLIVRPGECTVVDSCAYGAPAVYDGTGGLLSGNPLNGGSLLGYDAGTDAFDDEALVVTNDLDPAFAADPLGYDITNYHPTVHLINGKAFPATEVIDTQAGNNVLVRYANLGEADHSMGLSGMHQRTIGRDATALPHGTDDVVVPLNVGQTAEAMISVETDAKAGFRYALADQARQPGLNNADPAITFLSVWGDQAQPGKPTGEITNFSAPESAGNDPIGFAGTVKIPSGAADANKAVFTLDDTCHADPCTNAGAVTLMPSTFEGTIPAATLATLANGSHVLWVALSNDLGVSYGDAAGIAFTIDRAGPVVNPVLLDPMYSNGTGTIAISATADATLTGTGLVVSGTANVGGTCPALATQPTGSPLTTAETGATLPGAPAAIADLVGTVPAPTAEGSYTVFVSAVDDRGRWSNDGAANGAELPVCGQATLIVDQTAPVTSAGSIDPAGPNDGTQAYNGIQTFLEVVRIFAHVTDGVAGVAGAEGFIDTVGGNGTGFMFTPADGNFDSGSEDVYADIPLASIRTLTPGPHSIYIHGLDNAGNWENAAVQTSITVVSGAPLVNAMTYDALASQVAITGVSFGIGVTIDAMEYSVGPSFAIAGSGTSVIVSTPAANVSVVVDGIVLSDTSPSATENIWVRVHDSTGRWSAAVGLPTSSTPAISNGRRRLTGTAFASSVGGVASIEFSTGTIPAAGGSGTAINVTTFGAASLPYTYNKQGSAWAAGTVIWVRVRDAIGNWGPAVSVTVS